MDKFELKFPKKYIDKTDETLNRRIQELFPIKKKEDTNSQEGEDSCS